MCSPQNSSATSIHQGHSTRRKLWQLEQAYHCCVIGTCLSLAELRQTTKKFKVMVDGEMTDYKLHSIFVSSAGTATPPIKYIHKLLDKKYSQHIKRYAKARSADEFKALWKDALGSGDVAASFWALITNPYIDENLIQQVTGEVHMLSHISGASTRNDIKVLGKLKEQKHIANQAYSKSTSSMACRLRKKETEISQLRENDAQQKEKIQSLEKAKKRLDEIEQEGRQSQLEVKIESLTNQLYSTLSRTNQASKRINELELEINIAADRHKILEQAADESREELVAVESTLSRLLNSHCNNHCDKSDTAECPLSNLNGLNILYVGGRASQCSFFKTLVEQYNGSFLHHDGGKEDSKARLATILAQADAVLCPTDCISHDAYYRVKKHCDNQAKQMIMIPHASLSSFSKGLSEVAA